LQLFWHGLQIRASDCADILAWIANPRRQETYEPQP
jgi:hypothetical protein